MLPKTLPNRFKIHNCGSNGKTYKNGCFACCNKIKVVHPGVCNKNHNPCNFPNGRNFYKPVCTFNGESYDNDCIAKCLVKNVANSDFCFLSILKENYDNNHFPENGNVERLLFRKNNWKYLRGIFNDDLEVEFGSRDRKRIFKRFDIGV